MKRYPQTELLKIARVSAVTFNTWRYRNGLFPHTRADRKWNSYSTAEVCIARAVVILTKNGLPAQEAVDSAMLLQSFFDEVCTIGGGRLLRDSFAIIDRVNSEFGPRVRFVDRSTSLHDVIVGPKGRNVEGAAFVALDLMGITVEVMAGNHKLHRDAFSKPEEIDALYEAIDPQPHPDYQDDTEHLE